MSNFSQKELLSEGFLDTVRKAAAATAGAALGAVKNVGKDILKMDPNANLFKSISTGAVSGFKQGLTFPKDSPEGFVENELKTKWTNVFDYRSIKITKKEDAAPGANRSFKLTKVNRFFVYFTANRFKQAGSVESGQYKAAINRGSDNKFVLEEIRDSANRIIRGAKETTQTSVISWKELYDEEPEFQSGQPISVGDLAAWIESNANLRDRRVETLLDAANNLPISAIGIDYTTQQKRINEIIGVVLARTYGRAIATPAGPPQWDIDNLTPEQIKTVKDFFIRQRIFSESHKKTQLQLLESSYNLRYELPINKGN